MTLCSPQTLAMPEDIFGCPSWPGAGGRMPLAFRPEVLFSSVKFSSVAQSCVTLCDPMDCSTPGLPVHHQLPESTQTHAHRVGDAIQPSHPLVSPSPPALNLSQHQGLFQWASSLHQVAEVLEFQLQHQSFHWKSLEGLIGRLCVPRINSTWSQCICISFSTLLDLVC